MLSETQKIAAEVKALRGNKARFHVPKDLRLKIAALTATKTLSAVSDAVGVSGKTIHHWTEYQEQRDHKKEANGIKVDAPFKTPDFTVTRITSKPPVQEYVTLKRADGMVLSVPANSPLGEKIITTRFP